MAENRHEDASPCAELAAATAELRAYLAWAGDAGLVAPGAVARPPQGAAPQVPPQAPPQAPFSRAPSPQASPAAVGSSAAVPSSAASASAPPMPSSASTRPLPLLADVRTELGECTRCKLCKGRHKIVFGVGSERARLVFVGEAPGEDEDLQGEPFVGKAGQLLTKMIEAMGLRREDVYICNTVKCRPPNNRNPEPDELAACEPFLKGQLAALQPEVIVTLGKFAAQALLRDGAAISRLRGNWREYEGIPLMPTFHPAYLLRSPGEKGKVWGDLQLVMKKLGPAARGPA